MRVKSGVITARACTPASGARAPPLPLVRGPPPSNRPGLRCAGVRREQREALPVFEFRDEFIEAVKEHQVVVCVGETGSGAAPPPARIGLTAH